MATEYRVMESKACMPAALEFGTYYNVAVVENEKGTIPKMISARARGLIRIVDYAGKLSWGKTIKSQYGYYRNRALALARLLNTLATMPGGVNEQRQSKIQRLLNNLDPLYFENIRLEKCRDESTGQRYGQAKCRVGKAKKIGSGLHNSKNSYQIWAVWN